MPTTHPWKMVSFRLSAEEYAAVHDLWHAAGYRSISSFALCALRAFVPDAASANDSAKETKELKRRVEELAADVKRLSDSIRGEQTHLCSICRASVPAGPDGPTLAAKSSAGA